MTKQTVFINNNEMAKFVCPNCENTVFANVSKYKNIDKAVRIKCRCKNCGYSHAVLLERRQHYRKKVNIPGFYFWNGEKVKKPMMVKDLSRSGLGFESKVKNELRIGDKLLVEFRLNDKNKTLIIKEVVIRAMPGVHVGTEFTANPRKPKTRLDKAYDMAIAHYILHAELIESRQTEV